MDTPNRSIEEVILEDGRYPLEAVQFVRAGLNYTVQQVYKKQGQSERRHISGEQLCMGLRDLARQKWGMLAGSVLGQWNIHGTKDFGEIVFLLVETGWMQKQPSDCREDFDGIYDFDDEFGSDFELE